MKDFNYRFFLVFTFGLTLLFACSEKKEIKSTEDSFYSFVEKTPSTFFSGKITLANLLTDLHYQDIPKLNTLLKSEVLTLSKGFDQNQPIYFTIDSLFQADGSPTGVYLFIPVKQKDSLCDKLSSLGFLVEPGTTSNFIVGNNLSGRIDDNTAIIHLSRYASKNTIKTAYENTQKQVTTHTKLTTQSTALSMRLHLENMQRMLDALYLDRLASKREELLSLYQNSFINCNFNFKNGGLIGEIDFDFSTALKKRLFFNENAPATLSSISQTDFVSGIGLSINPTKADAFLEDFYPNFLSRLAENNLMMQFALMSLGKKPFSSITNGDIALAYHDQSMPTCYVSLGEQSNFIQKTITPYLSQSPIPNLSFNGNTLTNTTLKSASNSNKAGFYYTYQAKNDNIIRTIDHHFKLLDAIQSITFSLNNQGGTISIQGKKTTDGLLHQISMIYVKNLEALIAGM